jgi:hypothetical protein
MRFFAMVVDSRCHANDSDSSLTLLADNPQKSAGEILTTAKK